jgi:hypothetical protein
LEDLVNAAAVETPRADALMELKTVWLRWGNPLSLTYAGQFPGQETPARPALRIAVWLNVTHGNGIARKKQRKRSDMVRVTRAVLVAIVVAELTSCSRHQAWRTGGPRLSRPNDFVFYVQPGTILAGDTAVLRWSIPGASKVAIEKAPLQEGEAALIGTFDGVGTLQVSPAEDTVYLIRCEGATSYTCASATLRVRTRGRD